MANPRRKRRRSRNRTMSNPRRRHFRRRRNPELMGSLKHTFSGATLVDALWGGAGFIGTGFVANMLPVPASMKVGPMKLATEALSAWGISFAVGKVAGKKAGDLILIGGLIAVATDAFNMFLPNLLPHAAAAATTTTPGTAGFGSYLPGGYSALGDLSDTGGW